MRILIGIILLAMALLPFTTYGQGRSSFSGGGTAFSPLDARGLGQISVPPDIFGEEPPIKGKWAKIIKGPSPFAPDVADPIPGGSGSPAFPLPLASGPLTSSFQAALKCREGQCQLVNPKAQHQLEALTQLRTLLNLEAQSEEDDGSESVGEEPKRKFRNRNGVDNPAAFSVGEAMVVVHVIYEVIHPSEMGDGTHDGHGNPSSPKEK